MTEELEDLVKALEKAFPEHVRPVVWHHAQQILEVKHHELHPLELEQRHAPRHILSHGVTAQGMQLAFGERRLAVIYTKYILLQNLQTIGTYKVTR